jgi:hypothetical protein
MISMDEKEDPYLKDRRWHHPLQRESSQLGTAPPAEQASPMVQALPSSHEFELSFEEFFTVYSDKFFFGDF